MPELWTEDIKWKPELEIDADSFNAWVLKLFPQVKDMTPGEVTDTITTRVYLGDKIFHVRILPKMVMRPLGMFGPMVKDRARLQTCYGGKQGEVVFTDAVIIPMITGEDRKVWMSLTPMEVISQRPGIKKARGQVLIGGLGMGWFARRVLERKQVKQVVVADTNLYILDYFGKPLMEEFGDKLLLLHQDVYKVDTFGYDSILLDIWSNHSDAQYDKKLAELMAYHANVWAWGKGVN